MSVSFSVNIINDAIQEENETFSFVVNLQSGCLPVTIKGDDSFTITIIDDESNDIPTVCHWLLCVISLLELTVQFTNSTYFGSEKSGYIVLTIELLGGTASHDFNVSVTTSPVTATGEQTINNAFFAIKRSLLVHLIQ